jgi:NADH-quinone oxidoreductase subunit L
MIVRSHILFSLSPTTSLVVVVVGMLTAFIAATIALVQVDLKRILAYSTISQLGYMFVAVGVGAYATGMFHLTTHAFFKALLFLAAGSIMHSLNDVIDIRRMGGLRRKLPITFWTFLLGTLALVGFPLSSGFFSKDEILLVAFEYAPLLWALGVLAALLTAIYSFRAVFLAFWGQPRDWELHDHAHESPPVMTAPLVVLAVLAILGGVIGLPPLMRFDHALEKWLEPVFADLGDGVLHGLHVSLSTEVNLMVVSSIVVLLGIGLAYWFYVANSTLPEQLAVSLKPVFRLLVNKYYVDNWKIYSLLQISYSHVY